jgi:predicted nucleic acid-binding protein
VIVVDASIMAKLYRDEPGSEEAQALIAAKAGQMLAPDIFAIEVAGVIVRDANSDKLAIALQREKLVHLELLLASPVLQLVGTRSADIVNAAKLAIELGHPLKDCLYLALAIDRNCDLLTADARFAARARNVWNQVQVLGE